MFSNKLDSTTNSSGLQAAANFGFLLDNTSGLQTAIKSDFDSFSVKGSTGFQSANNSGLQTATIHGPPSANMLGSLSANVCGSGATKNSNLRAFKDSGF